MAGEYDKILRENFKTPTTNLLQQLIPADIVSIQPLVPKLQYTILEKETDTVAEVVTDDQKRFIFHIEWQSSNDSQMASRMALYDLLLYQTYSMEVMGIVLYVGNQRLRMAESLDFFDFHYKCRIIDVRSLDPEIFLTSDEPGELMFAILAGTGGKSQKVEIIQRIFSKLHTLFANDVIQLRIKIKQLELLSLLRGKDIQKLIIEEEQKMPVTIDIREDARYQQGVEEGREEGIEQGIEKGIEKKATETARRMFENGLDFSLVQNVTGLDKSKLEEIAKSISKA